MPTIPFYRRILPWLYLAIFIIIAPLLIFYTAGYRYNLKKAKIERNGTLLVDSNPKGASVLIDDRDTGEKTPISFQNLSPGRHTIRITKHGYHPWQKNLDIRPEQVTFTNDVWLWQNTQPYPDIFGDIRASQADPTQEKIALLLRSASSTLFQMLMPKTLWSMEPIRFPEPSSVPSDIHWKEDGQALFFSSDRILEKVWWINVDRPQLSLEALPSGTYRWSHDDLITIRDRTIIRLQPRTGKLTHELLEPLVVDKENNFTLQTTTGTSNVILRNSFFNRRFSLPAGHWRIAQIQKPYLLFRDQDRWLAVNTQKNNDELYAGQANGDDPRWLSKAKRPIALMM
ncbi:MAG: PEGA domain-containing protein, partial [Candidatus Uhrbacteria bacterium]|nr:PEGA domain-containing protein [Candidatus Uhrbacteria bacterium]